MYPSDFNEKLAKKHAEDEQLLAQAAEQRASLIEIARPAADATARNIGDLAIRTLSAGILEASFDKPTPTPEQSLKFGRTTVRNLVTIDSQPFLQLMTVDQQNTLSEQSIVGYAERTAA